VSVFIALFSSIRARAPSNPTVQRAMDHERDLEVTILGPNRRPRVQRVVAQSGKRGVLVGIATETLEGEPGA